MYTCDPQHGFKPVLLARFVPPWLCLLCRSTSVLNCLVVLVRPSLCCSMRWELQSFIIQPSRAVGHAGSHRRSGVQGAVHTP